MDKRTTIDGKVSLPDADLRLEVILAELNEMGLSPDDFVILRKSLFRRNFSREIEGITDVEYQSRRRKFAVHINRDGLYDRLPQDLIHQPEVRNQSGKSPAKAAIDDMSRASEKEKASRQFFLPFEQELTRMLLKLEWEERQFIFETNSDVSGELMGLLWDLPEYLDSLQRSKLGVIIPLLHRFAGNRERLSFILENITGFPVVVETFPPRRYLMEEAPLLGSATLGVDSILGGILTETQTSMNIRVRAGRLEELGELVPGGRTLETLEYLVGALAPIEEDVVFEPDLSDCAPSFVLDDSLYLGRLHYTTVL